LKRRIPWIRRFSLALFFGILLHDARTLFFRMTRMTLSRWMLLPICLSALLLAGCPTDGRRDSYDYLRSVVSFTIDPVAADHPFCQDSGKWPDGMTSLQECQSARKYRLRWERPEDTVGFNEYRVYVDTTPPGAPGIPWSEVRKDRSLASFIMEGRPSAADSIIFILAAGNPSPPVRDRTAPQIVRLDTTGRLDADGKLVFGISTSYSGGGVTGQPRITWVITTDRFSPYPLQPAFAPKARSLNVTWTRPRDPTSFFDPGADSGIIARYVLRVRRLTEKRLSEQPPFNPTVTYRIGGVDRGLEVTFTDTVFKNFRERRFRLPDSQRVFNRLQPDFRDSIYLTMNDLAPQDTLDVSLWAVDAENNASDSLSATRIRLTDTTQPTTPDVQLVAGSLSRNGFVYTFTASRDRVEAPNANILEYRITRRRIGSGAGVITTVDSVFTVRDEDRLRETFTDTVRYLPPGATYRIYVQAIDSTGHASEIDSIVPDVSTPVATFPGADSLATCPPGFIPIPGGTFLLGDNTSAANPLDEQPAVLRAIKSYCIEPYEHRTGLTSGPFQTRATWEQARDVCAALNPGAGTHLCTEAEWERACEGVESIPLVYGVQSERQDISQVRYTCNIGTNDSAMALTPELRDPQCLTYEGAFDLSGNLSEWVLDAPGPYFGADTLVPGQPLRAPTATSARQVRGGNYLNSNLNPSLLLRGARCSNRDTVGQLRPRPYPGCVDSIPRFAVVYGSRTRCLPVPDSLRDRTEGMQIYPARDSTQLLILLPGQTAPITYVMPADTAYRTKPSSAALTPKSLGVVTFVNTETSETLVDTLDASEMLRATDAGLTAIFAREAGPPWTVRRGTDGKYEIRYLYASSRNLAGPARKFYSNKAIGFRCCSNPVPAPAPKRRAR
jgi:formylglycine-generating enzyme required for sulfatase activity